MKPTIVFAGPTVSTKQILHSLPDAWIHEPLQCGDIYQLLRLKPERFILIDGYYEIAASIWHKEILFAMNEGVEVIGAASMGALRAAELAHFGMLGIGAIFEDYQASILTDDDEVAVLHLDAAHNYHCQSEAMVNIRASFKKACAQGIIDEACYDKLISEAKKLFYPERAYERIIKTVEATMQQDLSQLSFFLNAHAVNLKQEDALMALNYAATHRPTAPKPIDLNHTIYFKRLSFECNAKGFKAPYAWLPPQEKALLFLNDLPEPTQACFNHIAKAFNIAYCLAKANVVDVSNEPWLPPYQNFLTDDADFNKTLLWLDNQARRFEITWNMCLDYADTLIYAFYNHRTDIQPEVQSALPLLALAYQVFDGLIAEKSLQTHEAGREHHQALLLRDLSIYDLEEKNAWLAQENLTEFEWEAISNRYYQINLGVHYFLGLFIKDYETIESKNWLALVIRALIK